MGKDNIVEKVAVYFMFTVMALILVSGVVGYCMGMDDETAPHSRKPDEPPFFEWILTLVKNRLGEKTEELEVDAEQDKGAPVEIKVSDTSSSIDVSSVRDSTDTAVPGKEGPTFRSPLPPAANRNSDDSLVDAPTAKPVRAPKSKSEKQPPPLLKREGSSLDREGGAPPPSPSSIKKPAPRSLNKSSSNIKAPPPRSASSTSPASSEHGSDVDKPKK